MILLYSNNAGNLFLRKDQENILYQDDPYLNRGTSFGADAEVIEQGETRNWSEEWVHTGEVVQEILTSNDTYLIATYIHGVGRMCFRYPSYSARALLQLGKDEIVDTEKTYIFNEAVFEQYRLEIAQLLYDLYTSLLTQGFIGVVEIEPGTGQIVILDRTFEKYYTYHSFTTHCVHEALEDFEHYLETINPLPPIQLPPIGHTLAEEIIQPYLERKGEVLHHFLSPIDLRTQTNYLSEHSHAEHYIPAAWKVWYVKKTETGLETDECYSVLPQPGVHIIE